MPASPINKQARLWAARGGNSLGRQRNPETCNSPTTQPGAVQHVSRLVGRQTHGPCLVRKTTAAVVLHGARPGGIGLGRGGRVGSLQRHAADAVDAAAAWFYRRHQAAGACLDDGHAGMQFKCVVRDGFVSRPAGWSGLRLTNGHVTTKKGQIILLILFCFPVQGLQCNPTSNCTCRQNHPGAHLRMVEEVLTPVKEKLLAPEIGLIARCRRTAHQRGGAAGVLISEHSAEGLIGPHHRAAPGSRQHHDAKRNSVPGKRNKVVAGDVAQQPADAQPRTDERKQQPDTKHRQVGNGQ